jgi:uncharacterized protein with HEPN domain
LKDDWVYLRHILDEIEFIRGLTVTLAYKDLIEDKVREQAITRSLEIIGEAAKNVSDPLKARYPDVPWREMAGLRDRIIHGYIAISYYRDLITSEGKRLQFAENLNASRTTYDQLVIDDPLNATVWCIRGNYYNDAFIRYDEALASYNHALELDPTHAYCWYSKGITLQNMGRFNEAEICF